MFVPIQLRIRIQALKGHGNEPNFLRFLHKSLWPRSLTLHFEPFRFCGNGVFVFKKRLPVSVSRGVDKIAYCLAQTRTGIGLLGKPPAVKQFPPSEANWRTRLLRDPRANAGMKRTSVIEHNLYFAGLAIVG